MVAPSTTYVLDMCTASLELIFSLSPWLGLSFRTFEKTIKLNAFIAAAATVLLKPASLLYF